MLPSWIPGSYLLREFARQVIAIEARVAGVPVAVEQTAKGTWVVADAGGPVTVTMTVYAFDLSVRGAYFDRDRAFFNGSSLFLLPDGCESGPVELELERPGHRGAEGWQVATAMPAVDVDARGFGRYRAADYDELIDHPFEIGAHEIVEFTAAGVPHRLVLTGRTRTDPERVAIDLAQLCTTQIDFFGRPPPFSAYTFLGLVVGNGYGGLEHRASSSLVLSRNDLPRTGDPGIGRNYQRFLGLCSHEYFHSWHVKQSKPAAFMPYRLDRRNPTRLLWVFEGITTYYQELFLVRSGLLGTDAFLRRLGEIMTRVYRTPGRRFQSLEDSSFNAWDRLYKPDDNSPNSGVSYYSKGALIALALDMKLRTEGRATLDDIVLAIWRRHGSRGIGLPEDGFGALAAELGGESIREFLEPLIAGTDDPDMESLCAALGVRFVLRPSEGPNDAGGTPPAPESPRRVVLGAGFESGPAGLVLRAVYQGQAAEAAGLAPGDIIVAVDGFRAAGDTIGEQLARYEEGDELAVSFFRGDVLTETRLRIEPTPADTCYLELIADVAGEIADRRRAWIEG